MRLQLFFITCFFIQAAFGLSLKDKFLSSQKGDYIVLEQNKMISLISIYDKNLHHLILEEISIPKSNVNFVSYKEWAQNEAPMHTSWAMYDIDLDENKLLECFSFSKGVHLDISEDESLICKLLNIPFTPIPLEKRKKIGPPPLNYEPDQRAYWNPSFNYEKKKTNANFDVFEIIWPSDTSELANKTLHLYFDDKGLCPFPYFVQVNANYGFVVFKAIECGKDLKSSKSYFPKRGFHFIKPLLQNKEEVILTLKAPVYYKIFDLFAIDMTEEEKPIHPIEFTQTRDKELVTLNVKASFLKNTFQNNHRYIWIVSSKEEKDIFAETKDHFIWKNI
ncbi:MAG: hypothetical protein HZB76_04455 [Chlamydiae bacterium]|nr:hypothetical protein [Chlamydiota bacterium]